MITVKPLTLRQLHAVDTVLIGFAEGQKPMSSVEVHLKVLDAATASGIITVDTSEWPAAEARALAERIMELANEAREVPKV